MMKISSEWIIKNCALMCLILFIFCIGSLNNSNKNVVDASTKESDQVSKWAKTFGDELWDLAQRMTKLQEIKAKYKKYNARVEHKGNETLLNSMVTNLKIMLSRKIDAIRCIMNVAEEMSEQFDFNETEAQNYTYFSSKYSPLNGKNLTDTRKDIPKIILHNKYTYRNMDLNQDTHFYNISVNTSYSSVHVPTNIYDKDPKVLEALQWSEALDDVFVQNYNSDPALSWQYFGSETGILRHFPAKPWENKSIDIYDCRKRSWYIETATCSKDIVILLDNSGSMTGYRNFIAQLTVKSILDTFSNNDFMNIYNYSKEIDPLVPCFNNSLVQATPENLDVFVTAVKGLKPQEYADVPKALAVAFELLQKYRDIRRCNESKSGCNQAIMLLTDGVPGNLTDVFRKYNWIETEEGGQKIPVRIFTYLLGKEVTKVREIQWMACLNRGYYSHIQNLDEVQGEVLKYVTVIANPLVLQGVEHPPTWTHAFADTNYEEEDDDAPPRLMIAVGIPAFDRRFNRNGTARGARLLGVAGTDVPVDDIRKLCLPYKLGVNAYSFVVSNNGFVLLHPDLRPVEYGELKKNYNSIDLTEVEQFDEDAPPRDPGDQVLKLRAHLVDNDNGTMPRVTVKFHYDKMRRVSIETYDYYFTPLPNTPFSLGLAIPSGYGNTWIKVGDEVKRNLHMKINMSDFFIGENWKVHPDWVYCKYHYLEGHEFQTPESELRHFLQKLSEPGWKWSQQYEVEPIYEHEDIQNQNDQSCGGKTLGDEVYYCNKELMQLLIFDAKVTNSSFGEWDFEEGTNERELIERYNATLRYVATMSGLTRWQFIFGEVEIDSDFEFGDYHTTAIDETWYKSAILQHQIDSTSFVYSVPHDSDHLEIDGEIKVTASYALFPKDGGVEAPACVVGFQFSHDQMYDRFMEITSTINCQNCSIRPCADDLQDCYVIDHNGYVVLSEQNDTGRFFGEVEGAIMESLIELNIFKVVTVYDLQALCKEVIEVESRGNLFLNPFQLIAMTLKYILIEFFYYLSKINLWAQGNELFEYTSDDDSANEDYSTSGGGGGGAGGIPSKNQQKSLLDEENEFYSRPKLRINVTTYRVCDKKTNLYVLQQNYAEGIGKSICSRPYFYHKIPYSNLLLIVVNAEHQTCNPILYAEPEEIFYDAPFPCHKRKINDLPSRRLEDCFTEHPQEENVTYCGKAITITFSYVIIILTLSITTAFNLS